MMININKIERLNTPIWNFILGSFFVMCVWCFILQFFPNQSNAIGHDYSYFLNLLFDGRIWFDQNGLDIQWYTPSFGGGLPKFPDPQGMQYSLPQVFSHFLHPLDAIKVTMLFLLAFAYIGVYLLSQELSPKSFFITKHAIALMFICNCFFISRMAIGHITYHVIMYSPMYAYLTLNMLNKRNISWLIFSAIVFALGVYGGAGNYSIFLNFSILFILVPLSTRKVKDNTLFWVSSQIILGLVFSGPQISASLSFISHFPREHVIPPQFHSYFDSIFYAIKMLFWGPLSTNFATPEQIRSLSFLFQQHEMEFSIGLGLPILFLSFVLYTWKRNIAWDQNLKSTLFIISFFIFLLSIFNVYHPKVFTLIKLIPILKSFSSFFRFYSLLIIPLVLLSILIMRYFSNSIQILISICLATLSISDLFLFNDGYYHLETYSFQNMSIRYTQYISGTWAPKILGISNHQGNPNEHFLFNYSSGRPYQPIFGYKLETYPGTHLQIGPASKIMKSPEGLYYNFLNPICIVFPEKNNCVVGENFTIDQMDLLSKHLAYQPISFKKNTLVWLSELLFLLLSSLVFTYWIFSLITYTRKRYSRPLK
jgi:hypothetical protein